MTAFSIFLLVALICVSIGFTHVYLLYTKHERDVKRFHKFYDDKATKPRISQIYTSKDGTKWYQFDGMLEMSAQRATKAEMAMKFADLCMTPDYFAKKLMEMEAFANKQNFSKIVAIVNDLKQKSTLAAERTSLFSLANELFLIEGENPIDSSTEFFDKKMAIWEKDPECAAFFLNLAFSVIRDLEKLSEVGLLDYLNKQELERQLTKTNLSRLISTTS